MKPRRTASPRRARRGDGVVRVQTGLRIDRRLHKVLRGLADYLDVSLGDLIELIALRAFADPEGFSKGTRRRIAALRDIHGHDREFAAVRRRLFADD